MELGDYDHPSWRSAAATLASYGVILGLMTLLLFGVPYALFLLFG